MLSRKISYFNAISFIFILSCAMTGLYYELAAAFASILLAAACLLQAKKESLKLRLNAASLFAGALFLFYAASCFWAADPGLAAWGIAKYLPVPLFGLCFMQLANEERIKLLTRVPWAGCFMTAASFLMQFIPAFQKNFSVNGRLAGFFQYPNTFACFLLIGLAVLFLERPSKKMRLWDILCGLLLFFGLFQAGSRTVFLLAVPVFAAVLLLRRNKKILFGFLLSAAGGIAAAAVLEIIFNSGSGAQRLSSISANASTLLGRLLYWKDAAPVILKHPLGMGYLGYYVSQGSFQNGVYSVRWAHNDLLQLLLDIGWIPAALMAAAVIRALLSKRIHVAQKTVLLVLLLHCMMDFDLEFVFMYGVLLLCLDWEDGKPYKQKLPGAPRCLAGICLLAFSLYAGITSSLTYCGRDALASAIYPWNTLSNTNLLAASETTEEMETLAAQIQKQDSHVALAWDALARSAYAEGDFEAVIRYKKNAIAQAKYSIEEYEDYFELLKTGVMLYEQAGDQDSASICLKEIFAIEDMLETLEENTDPLAYRITDRPDFSMPEEYWQYCQNRQ